MEADKSVTHTWFEVGYGAEVAPGFELSASLINSSKEVSGYDTGSGKAEDNMFMVVGLTKSFDIM